MSALKKMAAVLASATFIASFATVSAASALTVSCAGTPSATSITWNATSANGVAPVAFLWGNGSTFASQTLTVSPGTYSMTIQGTDASSTVATSTCAATVVQGAPSITSFVATPATITSDQSTVLSWVVGNASSTSIDNGIGAITASSVTVSPTVTTTYNLSAVNPGGTSNASITVTVNAPSTGGTDVASQIQALLAQISALKAQILTLIQQQGGNAGSIDGTVGSTTPSVTPGACNFGRDLEEGDSGDDVKQLQQSLSSDPSILPPGLDTGFFGPITREAMKKFQEKFDISSSSTGFFGPKTRGFMKEHCGEGEAQAGHNEGQGNDEGNNVHPNMMGSTSMPSINMGNEGGQGNGGEGEGRGNSGGRGGRDN